MGEEGPLGQERFICLFCCSNGFRRSGTPLGFHVSRDHQVSRVKGEELRDLSVFSNLGQLLVCRTVLRFDKVQYCVINLKANPGILFLAMSLLNVFSHSVGPKLLTCTWTLGSPSC
jgi:hypothetical protein